MPRKLPLLLLLLLAACPEQVGSQCPPQTVALGQYTLTFSGHTDAGDQCAATPPDGGAPVPLVQANGGQRGGTLCFGSGADGGPQLQLVVPGKGVRPSDLLPDGGFHFAGHSDPVSGTACSCAVAIDETFDGYLQTSPATTPVAVQSDGGLPPITAVTGVITDTLSTPAGTTGCLCALPCPVTYDISGTRF
jgi:hypothetical protein